MHMLSPRCCLQTLTKHIHLNCHTLHFCFPNCAIISHEWCSSLTQMPRNILHTEKLFKRAKINDGLSLFFSPHFHATLDFLCVAHVSYDCMCPCLSERRAATACTLVLVVPYLVCIIHIVSSASTIQCQCLTLYFFTWHRPCQLRSSVHKCIDYM